MEPPGGWTYRDLDTNVWLISRRNLDDLIVQVLNHRRGNKLPCPEDLPAKIESCIAYRVPPELAVDLPNDRKASAIGMQVFNVSRNTNQWLQTWVQKGMQKYSNKEADERAASCLVCENNRREICLSCKGLDIWVNNFTGRSTTHDPQLGVCACDGIIIYATIHTKPSLEFMFTHVDDTPEFCWKHTPIAGTTKENLP